VEEGVIGVWLSFGAPILHSMLGLSFGWHWHGVGAYVNLSRHSEANSLR